MSNLIVPTIIEEIIQRFDKSVDPFSRWPIWSEIKTARETLGHLAPAENIGSWSELLAFGLTRSSPSNRPWGTHFAPMSSGVDGKGRTIYFPDAREANRSVIDHWIKRSETLSRPILGSGPIKCIADQLIC